MSTFHPYPNKMLSIPQLEPNMHSFVALQHISLFQVGPNGWSRGRFNSPIAKMDKIHHPYMANGKNANVSLALSRVWTTFPFIVQWISHETTKQKKHNKFRHNAHLFSHRVHSECWVNCSSLMVFEIDVTLMLNPINCCLLIGMLANVYPPPSPPSWSHPRAKGHWELFLGNIKPIIETCTFI